MVPEDQVGTALEGPGPAREVLDKAATDQRVGLVDLDLVDRDYGTEKLQNGVTVPPHVEQALDQVEPSTVLTC